MMPPELSDTNKHELKGVVKEAIKEWLTEQAAEFGRWSFKFFVAAICAGALYLAFLKAGWKPPQ